MHSGTMDPHKATMQLHQCMGLATTTPVVDGSDDLLDRQNTTRRVRPLWYGDRRFRWTAVRSPESYEMDKLSPRATALFSANNEVDGDKDWTGFIAGCE